jgi:hypothetical protein
VELRAVLIEGASEAPDQAARSRAEVVEAGVLRGVEQAEIMGQAQ